MKFEAVELIEAEKRLVRIERRAITVAPHIILVLKKAEIGLLKVQCQPEPHSRNLAILDYTIM